ncbi:MAG: methyltransferase domain-containing protein [Candidatus Acidiferrales bacterium]
MDKIKQHFEDEAREFDRIIVTLIPEYPRMVEALIAAIPFDHSAPVRVIDLGCGTGTVAASVLDAFQNAQVTCLDLAENMIAMAQAKLARHSLVRYVVGDFNAFDFNREYDVVVSSLALHHLVTDEDKREFYGRIHKNLASGGVFYNADVVLASSDFLQDVYMNQWRNFMSRNVSKDEIEGKWIPKYEAEDRPAKLMDQLKWMAEIGFAEVDVLWKYYNFAVYGGVKR